MTKVWLMGGFGNVLFQILAYNVIAKSGREVFFVKKLTERNWITKQLGWTIHQKLYGELIDENKFMKVKNFKAFIIVLVGFISKKTNKSFKSVAFYNKSMEREMTNTSNLFGYFQDITFLNKYKDELCELGKELRIKYSLVEEYPIVVHYRRGDSEWAVKFSYYYDEIKKLLKKESLPILIVTDSIDIAKNFFIGLENVKIISSANALDDFKYLLSTRKIYCAPSTFSWWAAHSLKENSEIIMPKFFKENLGIFVKSTKLKVI